MANTAFLKKKKQLFTLLTPAVATRGIPKVAALTHCTLRSLSVVETFKTLPSPPVT